MASRERVRHGPSEQAPAGSGLLTRVAYAWRALAREQRATALAALALWLTMFLPWYSRTAFVTVDKSPRSAAYSVSAFGAFSFVEAAVLLVSVAVLVLLFARAERRAFHLPGGDGAVIALAGAWVALLIFYRMLDKPGTQGIASGTTTWGVQWGIFIAFCAPIIDSQWTRSPHRSTSSPMACAQPATCPDRLDGARRLPRDPPQQAGARRGTGWCRQDRAREGARAGYLGRELVRLQCYEGLDEAKALYEWNYRKQLLRIQAGG
jgi:hypothetical protein